MTVTDHTEFEVVIEKRIRGEESPEERSRLDAHLAECDECRLILDEAVQTVRAAHVRLREARNELDWPTLERHLNAEVDVLRSTTRVQAGIAVLGPLTTAGILVCLAPIMGWRWVVAAAGAEAVVVGAIVLWLVMRTRARQRELESGVANVDALWAAELRRRRRAGRLNTVFVVMYFATIAIVPLFYMPLWPILFFLFNPFLMLPMISPELRRRRQLYERGLIDRATYASRQPIQPVDAGLAS
jgi:anti-sigma factor RsiW